MNPKWEIIGEGGEDEVHILRNPAAGRYALSDVVRGIERLSDIRLLCEKRELDEEFVKTTPLLIDDAREFYMYVDDGDKTLVACRQHISDSDLKTVYLDFVHELVHMFQLYDCRELFDRTLSYVERPTEIEAYTLTVKEGRRIGMTEMDIFDYLRVDWISEDDHRKLARTVGVNI